MKPHYLVIYYWTKDQLIFCFALKAMTIDYWEYNHTGIINAWIRVVSQLDGDQVCELFFSLQVYHLLDYTRYTQNWSAVHLEPVLTLSRSFPPHSYMLQAESPANGSESRRHGNWAHTMWLREYDRKLRCSLTAAKIKLHHPQRGPRLHGRTA